MLNLREEQHYRSVWLRILSIILYLTEAINHIDLNWGKFPQKSFCQLFTFKDKFEENAFIKTDKDKQCHDVSLSKERWMAIGWAIFHTPYFQTRKADETLGEKAKLAKVKQQWEKKNPNSEKKYPN